ncbi:hypothetical protein [Actinoplanes sp. NBRC 101535]|uniref:hypothetical protein n=1 Tax=Actinoplanes sp. NBRC 101535 TaxID=3032196 RepID=UPI0024A101BF|nr:hypothetical protein [Actinoplanes sp. NBRC 101535]GLY07601.1 hypothetical protein Acsp01_79800 [Actinoplanes sp. NBRC 101535]
MTMSRLSRYAVAATVLLGGLTATAVEPALAAPSAPPAPAAPSAPVALAVALARSGGITGATAVFAVAGRDTPHARKVMKAASTPAFRALGPKYLPAKQCCDRYRYELEVGYADGSKKKVVTMTGTPGAPAALLTVIDLMEHMPAPEAPTLPAGFPFS